MACPNSLKNPYKLVTIMAFKTAVHAFGVEWQHNIPILIHSDQATSTTHGRHLSIITSCVASSSV